MRLRWPCALASSAIVLAVAVIAIQSDNGLHPCSERSSLRCTVVTTGSTPRDRNVAVAAESDEPGQRALLVLGGGPGQGLLWEADAIAARLHESLGESRRLLFVDPFGVGLSQPIECLDAEHVHDDATSRAIGADDHLAAARAFADACVDALGLDQGLLPAFSSRDAAADLEAIRADLGIESWDIYGQSYGTRVAQLYAAAYPDRVGSIILDAPVELQPSVDSSRLRGEAFDMALEATFEWCRHDESCQGSLGMDPAEAYGIVRGRLAAPPPDRITALGPGSLDAYAATRLTDAAGRLELLRLIVATRGGDWAGLAATLEAAARPAATEATPGSRFSDAAYYATQCADWTWDTDDPDERAAQFLSVLPVSNSLPAQAAVVLRDLPCAYWPGIAGASVVASEGSHRTVIIAAGLDWAAPPAIAETLWAANPSAEMIAVDGGPHVALGRGIACVDEAVRQFLASTVATDARRVECSVALVGPGL